MDFLKRYTRNPSAVLGLALLVGILLAAASAGLLYPDNPLKLAGRPLQWPFSNPEMMFGTDHVGRNHLAAARQLCQ